MPHANFIKSYKTSTDLASFLQETINDLENTNDIERKNLIKQLLEEEQILLITLIYLGRGELYYNELYKTNFYNAYKSSYTKWKGDRYLASQIAGNGRVIDDLRNALNKCNFEFKLK